MQTVSSANGGSMATFPLQPFKQLYKQKGNRWSTYKQQAAGYKFNSIHVQSYVTATFSSSTVLLGGGVWLPGSGFKPPIYRIYRPPNGYRKLITERGIIQIECNKCEIRKGPHESNHALINNAFLSEPALAWCLIQTYVWLCHGQSCVPTIVPLEHVELLLKVSAA